MIDRRTLISVGLATSLASWSAPARAEVAEVHLVRQFGIGYLPLTIMLHEKLVEKHAAKAGLPTLKTKWSVLGNAGDDPRRLRRHRTDGHGLGQNAR